MVKFFDLFNGPFLSFRNSHFQKEAKNNTFLLKMSFFCVRIKNHSHIIDFALSLDLKQRVEATIRNGLLSFSLLLLSFFDNDESETE